MVRPTRHVKKDKDLVERVTRNATSVPISFSKREDKDLGHRKDVVKYSFKAMIISLADGRDNDDGSGCMMLAKVAEELNGQQNLICVMAKFGGLKKERERSMKFLVFFMSEIGHVANKDVL
nr:putative endopeptidase, NLPC/P60 domain, LRAT-like domain protein [Tanacetum cinerariifolium]